MTRARASRKPRYDCLAPICDQTTPQWTFFCNGHWNELPPELKAPLINKACLRLDDGHPNGIAAKPVRAAVEWLSRERGLIE